MASLLPPCPFFFQNGRVSNRYLCYTLAPIVLVLGAPLALVRIILAFLGTLIFILLAFCVNLGTDIRKPLPPLHDKFCVKLFNYYALYISIVTGYVYWVKNKELAQCKDAPIVVANHSSIMDAFVFSLKSFGHPVGKEGVLSNWAMRQIFTAARVVIVKRPPSKEMRDILQMYTSPSASEAEIMSINPQEENIPTKDAEKLIKYQKLLERRNKYGIESTTEILSRRVHDTKNHWKQIVIFPTGTITPSSCLLRFKTGAFRLGVPVQPVTVKYHSILSTCWLTDSILFNLYKILVNPITIVEMTFHAPMSLAENELPHAFADRVGNYMAKALGATYTNYTNDDMFYFYGYKDLTACTEDWVRDYGWMQRLSDFSKKYNINPSFGFDQRLVNECYRKHIKESK